MESMNTKLRRFVYINELLYLDGNIKFIVS